MDPDSYNASGDSMFYIPAICYSCVWFQGLLLVHVTGHSVVVKMRDQILYEARKMRGRETSTAHWALFPLVAGILIGVSVSTVVLLQPYTAITNVYLQLPSQEEETSLTADLFIADHELRRLMNELGAARVDTRSGAMKLADEANAKAPIYYAVMMQQRHSAELLDVLRATWTRDISTRVIEYFIRSEEEEKEEVVEDNERDGLSREEMEDKHYGEIETKENVIELSSNAPDEMLSYEVISHICRNRINTTKWYVLTGDNVYVKSNMLEGRLQRYENIPAYGYLGRRRSEDGRDCAKGPVTILSHHTLSELCQSLHVCGEEKKSIESCLKDKLHRECNQLPTEGELDFLSLDTDIRGSITEKENVRALHSALTISPVPDSKTMYNIHQAVVGGQLNSTQHDIRSLKWMLDRMTELLPSTDLSDTHREGSEVVSVDDVVSWKLVHNDGLLSDEQFSPTRNVPGVWKEELENMIEKAVQYISTKDNAQHVYNRLVNAYWRVDPLISINYIIDIETRKTTEKTFLQTTNRYRVAFTRPLNPPEISHTLSQVSVRVTIVVCFTSEEMERLEQFLQRLQAVLERDQKIDLVAVQMRSPSEKQRPRRAQGNLDAKSIFSLYSSKYQSASFTLLESPALLSRSHAVSIVLHESRPSDLLFLGDLDLQFEEGFLERCRSLSLQGQQAYFPMAFSLRDPGLLASLNHSLIEGALSQHDGHWLVESYSIACVYAADIQALRSQSDLKGVVNDIDMEEVYRTLLKKGYEMIRAPDKQLKRVHRSTRSCDLDLIGHTLGDSCRELVESDEPQYLQTRLSALLFDHEGENSANKY